MGYHYFWAMSWDQKVSENHVEFYQWGSEFSSYQIELRNRVTQNDVTLPVTNSKMFIEILFSSY